MARDLKRRGFTFVGPTTAYAFMQATGIVNDHLSECSAYARVEAARNTLTRPSSRS
jgi:DNA-3-methyladenine glycosylase I